MVISISLSRIFGSFKVSQTFRRFPLTLNNSFASGCIWEQFSKIVIFDLLNVFFFVVERWPVKWEITSSSFFVKKIIFVTNCSLLIMGEGECRKVPEFQTRLGVTWLRIVSGPRPNLRSLRIIRTSHFSCTPLSLRKRSICVCLNNTNSQWKLGHFMNYNKNLKFKMN